MRKGDTDQEDQRNEEERRLEEKPMRRCRRRREGKEQGDKEEEGWGGRVEVDYESVYAGLSVCMSVCGWV